MEKEINRIHKRLRRSKFAVFLIIAFLALLTYLLIVVAGQVSNEEALTTQPRATVVGTGESPQSVLPGYSCPTYQGNIDFIKSTIKYMERDWGCDSDPTQKRCQDLITLKQHMREIPVFIASLCNECIYRTGDRINAELPGYTCETYNENISFLKNYVVQMMEHNNCTQGYMGGENLPEGPPDICDELNWLYDQLNQIEQFIATLCDNCPKIRTQPMPGVTGIRINPSPYPTIDPYR